ncbi:MAG: nitroreductase family deazaflavin-dependent oxidoreductase [Acidimicrobiia bacterium]
MARTYRLGFFRKLVNVVAAAGLRVGLAPRASYLLTTTGRKTGRRHTTPVWAFAHDGERFLVSPYGEVGWVHNARAAGEVTLTRGRKSTTHPVTEVAPAEAAPILKRYMNKVAVTRPFFDATKDAPVAEFEAEAARHPVFRLGPPK